MSKQLTMWCVFDNKGRPIMWALGDRRAKCINMFTKYFVYSWEEHKKRGYTCRKVRVTIEEVKPKE